MTIEVSPEHFPNEKDNRGLNSHDHSSNAHGKQEYTDWTDEF